MTIILNGTPREFTELTTMNGLLEAVDLAGKPVVVEHNQVALLPREILTAVINDGDVIEIVQITAGG
ncbi:MAG: sulfur carrier protein ThiS [Prosthecobacter sp.]